MSTVSGGESEVHREMKAKCQSIDKEKTGLISIEQLQSIMHQLGEDVSLGDVEEMVDEAKCSSGKDQVQYEKFLQAMYADDGDDEEEDS